MAPKENFVLQIELKFWRILFMNQKDPYLVL